MKFKILKTILILEIILFIFLGLDILIQINNSIDTNNCHFIEEEVISEFNSQWEGYQGKNQTARMIQNLYSAVISSNASEMQKGTERMVSINNVKPEIVPKIENTTTYTVTATYDNDGFIINFDINPIINNSEEL